jgi:Protein of unknown function (DUF3987)/Domain of unknown function (DUF3854)
MMLANKTSLTPNDLAALERDSWIDAATADAWGLYRVDTVEGAALVGRTDREDYSGIVFPVYGPGERKPKEYFLRRDHPPLEAKNGTVKQKQKYLAPPGRGNRLLFGPGESAEALTDTALPILLVEGLKKTVAAWRLARHEDGSSRFLVCGISGAWNWKGTIGKAPDATGMRVDVKGPIPDLDRVTWTNRKVFVLYDSDTATNENVLGARRSLVKELKKRGANVIAPDLPALDELTISGFDDLLAQWGPDRVLDWLDAAQDGAAAVEDPVPISLDELEVPSFPTSLIPSTWLREMVEATAAATETPVELGFLLSLAVTATAIQKKYVVEAEVGYSEPLNLWAVVALDSGTRKTPVLKEMTAPLLDFERQHAATISQEVTRAESARHLAEDRIKYLRQKAAKANGADLDSLKAELSDAEAALPEVPKALRLWAQDVTPEKLGQLMADHGEKIAILSDEGGLFDILAGRYSQGVPNLDLFLQAFSGAAYRVDRGSRPPVFMREPALTLGLSPQPAVLKGLARIPGFRGRGLLARAFYALPHSTLGHRTLEPRPVPLEVRASYSESIISLLNLAPQADGRPHRLTFSDEASREWKAFQRHVEVELRDGGTFEHIKDWASKLPGGVARLAGVLHCADHADGKPHAYTIGLPTMEAALALGALLERHALAAFGLMAVDSALDAAHKVWGWIKRRRQPTFSKRDCFQALKGTFPDMAGIQPAFELLIERGYLFPLPLDNRVGRPSQGYRVNSRIVKEWTHGMA